MRRSEINDIMREAIDFLQYMNFLLPPFAFWSSDQWKQKGEECREIVDQQLGWDITDFGSNDFERMGLFLFTIRNGTLAELQKKNGRVYAEKILITRAGQVTPAHFHHQKMEDIINRGGGNLILQLWNSTDDDLLADTDVTVVTDGVKISLPGGGIVRLEPGESITLPQRLYHKFWGEDGCGTVLVGEVSRVNDDRVDNKFFENVGRFPTIVEDENPLHLLYSDYATFYSHAGISHAHY